MDFRAGTKGAASAVASVYSGSQSARFVTPLNSKRLGADRADDHSGIYKPLSASKSKAGADIKDLNLSGQRGKPF